MMQKQEQGGERESAVGSEAVLRRRCRVAVLKWADL